MPTAPAQWDESTAVPVSGQSQQWDESTAVPLRPAAPAPQAAPGPQPAAAPAPQTASAQPPAPRQPDTIGPAPEPGRIERARQWLVNSNPGQMLERNAPGVASALGLTPTESDAARQERHATDTFPYHPIQAAEQINKGMRVNQGYADAYDKLAGEHPDWDEDAVRRVLADRGITPATISERAGGAHKVVSGLIEEAKPLMLVGAAAAPLRAAVGLGLGLAGQRVGEKTATALGATPNEAALTGDVAGLGGAILGSQVHGDFGDVTARVPDPVTGDVRDVPVKTAAVGGPGFGAAVGRDESGQVYAGGRVGPYSKNWRSGGGVAAPNVQTPAEPLALPAPPGPIIEGEGVPIPAQAPRAAAAPPPRAPAVRPPRAPNLAQAEAALRGRPIEEIQRAGQPAQAPVVPPPPSTIQPAPESPQGASATPQTPVPAPAAPAAPQPQSGGQRPAVQASGEPAELRKSAQEQKPDLEAMAGQVAAAVPGTDVVGPRVKKIDSMENKAGRVDENGVAKTPETIEDPLGVRLVAPKPAAVSAVEQAVREKMPVVSTDKIDSNGLDVTQFGVAGRPGEPMQTMEVQVVKGPAQAAAMKASDADYARQKEVQAEADKAAPGSWQQKAAQKEADEIGAQIEARMVKAKAEDAKAAAKKPATPQVPAMPGTAPLGAQPVGLAHPLRKGENVVLPDGRKATALHHNPNYSQGGRVTVQAEGSKTPETFKGSQLKRTPAAQAPGPVGAPLPERVQQIKDVAAKGTPVKIFTARGDDPEVKRWLQQHGLGNLPVTNVKGHDFGGLIDNEVNVPTNSDKPFQIPTVPEGKTLYVDLDGTLAKQPMEGQPNEQRNSAEQPAGAVANIPKEEKANASEVGKPAEMAVHPERQEGAGSSGREGMAGQQQGTQPAGESAVQAKPGGEENRKEEVEEKEPWEMTRDEYAKNQRAKSLKVWEDHFATMTPNDTIGRSSEKAERDNESGRNERRDQAHENTIRHALEDGKPVPPEVLKDYPDLEPAAPKAVEKAVPAKRPTRADGRLIPQAGDQVYKAVPGFGGVPAYVNGKAFKSPGGFVRIRDTGTNALIGGRGATGKTYALDDSWTVRGDPEVERRKTAREEKEKARKEEREAEERGEKTNIENRIAKYGELKASDVKFSDVLEDPQGKHWVVREVLPVEGRGPNAEPFIGVVDPANLRESPGNTGNLAGWRKVGTNALVEPMPDWRAELAKEDGAKAPEPPVLKPEPAAKPVDPDERDRAEIARLEAMRFKTRGQENQIEILKARIGTPADKFKVGEGVGYRVASGGRGTQINRGFRVVEVLPESKEAVIRQVADTGLTSTGGNYDKIGDQTIHVGDLVRDRSYDAKPQFSAGARAKVEEKPKSEPKVVQTTPQPPARGKFAEQAAQQTAARFRKVADGMQTAIDNGRRPMTQNPTPKRMAEYRTRSIDADEQERTQKAFRALADAHEAGTVPKELAGLRTKDEIGRLVYKGLDTSGGYYSRVPRQDYHDKSPAGKMLQEMIEGKPSAEKTAAQVEQAKLARIKQLEAEVQFAKVPGSFPTPKPLAERLVREADIKPGMSVLEPSAGKGNIVDAIKANTPDAKIDTVERQPKLAEILKLKGYNVAGNDFLEHNGQYDRIVMNPPFENGQDIEHLQRAYDMLKPGGRVVAITSESPFFRTDKKYAAFRDWLEEHNGTSEKLDAGSFTGKDSERQTGVATRMVVIDKPEQKPAEVAQPEKPTGTALNDMPTPSAMAQDVVREMRRKYAGTEGGLGQGRHGDLLDARAGTDRGGRPKDDGDDQATEKEMGRPNGRDIDNPGGRSGPDRGGLQATSTRAELAKLSKPGEVAKDQHGKTASEDSTGAHNLREPGGRSIQKGDESGGKETELLAQLSKPGTAAGASDRAGVGKPSDLGTKFYSNPFFDPGLYKQFIGDPIKEWASDKETTGDTQKALMRETRGQRDRREAIAAHKLSKELRDWDRRSRADSLAFMNAVEHVGGKTIDDLAPKDRDLAELLSAMGDHLKAKIEALQPDVIRHWIENYYAHLWEKPSQARSVIQAMYASKRPFAGRASFLRQRTVPNMQDGIDMGLKPATWNPVRNALLKFHEMNQFIMGHETLQVMKDSGTAKYVRAGSKSPDGWVRLDDRIGTVYGREKIVNENKLDAATYDKTYMGGNQPIPSVARADVDEAMNDATIIRGYYYAPADAAKAFNNYMSTGLAGRFGVYDALRWANNNLNIMQLAISGFHATMTTFAAASGDTGLAIQQATEGKPIEAGVSLFRGVTALPSLINTLRNGIKLHREYVDPGTYAEMSRQADAIARAGGRFAANTVEIRPLDKAVNALRNGAVLEGLSAVPGTLLHAITDPLMKFYVPMMKFGAFCNMSSNVLENAEQGNWSPEQTRVRVQEAWKSVDNRFGELVRDNLFWHKALLDVLDLTTRSVGYTYGTINEYAGAAYDTAKQAGKAASGEKPRVTDRMAFAIASFINAGILGGALTYLMTGQRPRGWKDYYFPKKANGSRLSMPVYPTQIINMMFHPVSTMTNKISPILGAFTQALQNRDFYGTEIRHPDDSTVKQLWEFSKWAARQPVPFAAESAERQLKQRGAGPSLAEILHSARQHPGDVVAGFFGFNPAPAYIEHSTAYNLAQKYSLENRPPGTKTAEDTARYDAKQAIRTMQRTGDVDQDQIDRYVQQGVLKDEDVDKVMREADEVPIVHAAKSLHVDQYLNVYQKATPEEREALEDHTDKIVERERREQIEDGIDAIKKDEAEKAAPSISTGGGG